jgi:N-methylhydantoinase A
VLVPVVDIVEIGAGGGSIAWADAGGSVRVGPQSAGADPGPGCYGRGGAAPTVTDAKLAAGVLDPDYYLGGRLRLRPELADEALRAFGAEVGAPPDELANGIIRLVDASMINALKLVSVRRGYDPRDFVLVAAGGGGSMHAASLAADLEVKRVVVPAHPGVFSAWGMIAAEPRVDIAQTRTLSLSELSADELTAHCSALEQEAGAELAAEGVAPGGIRFERTADLRYRGQEHTVRVPLAPGLLAPEAVERDFHALHRQKYVFDLEGDPVEVVTFHVAAFGRLGDLRAPTPATGRRGSTPSPHGRRRVDFDADGLHEARVFRREQLPVGFETAGPLVVEEETTTTLVHPGQALEVDEHGNLIVWLA